jgi:hypothetical protein
VDAGEDFAFLTCGYGIRLDNRKRAFDCHLVVPPKQFLR